VSEQPDIWGDVPEADDVPPDLWEPYTGQARPIGEDGLWLPSPALCEWVRERSEHVLIGFSMGKDSITTWLRLREHWPAENLHPYFLYTHPHTAHEHRSLAYYERELGTRIIRLPHKAVFHYLNDGIFQTPANLPVIWGALLHDFEYRDIYALIAQDLGIEDTQPWVAHGVRSADSPMRRMLFQKNGPWRPRDRVFYPIHDFYVADVRAALDRTGIKLPVDYRMFGRSYDGLDARFTGPLRKHFPEDYERLTELYPLVGLDQWRRGGPHPDE
jgi:hypothetical protein